MKTWKVLVAVLALASGLPVAPATAAGSGSGSRSEKAALTEPRALPGGPSWNLPAGGLSWDKLRGKVVIVDLWNWH